MASVSSARNMGRDRSVSVAGSSHGIGLAVLWILAILVFGVGDLLTTAAVLGLGGSEGNAIVAALMQVSGGSIWPLTLTKGALLSGMFLISYLKLGSYAWTIPAVLASTGSYLLIHNIAVLMILI